MIAIAELVDVEAKAGAHIAQGRELGHLGAGEIIVCGQLHVASLTREGSDLEARPFGERGVVGKIVAACGRRRRWCASRRTAKANACGVCTMRRWLRSSVPVTQPAGIDGLDGVGNRDRRHRRAVVPAAAMARVISAAERTAGRRRAPARGPGDGAASASRPARTEACRVAPPGPGARRSMPADCRPEERAVVAVDDRLHGRNPTCAGQSGKARPDHRLARMRRYCLGTSPPARSPRPAATTTAATSLSSSAIRNTMLRHGFSPSGRYRKPGPGPCLRDLSAESGFFAVQHLRIRRGWLNSMQPENAAYFVCRDLK